MPSTSAADPSLAAARRLPRQAAAIVALLTLLQLVADVVLSNQHMPPEVRLPWGSYLQPHVLASITESWLSSSLLLGLIAWSALRSHLEHHGASSLRPMATRAVFTLALIILSAGFLYGSDFAHQAFSSRLSHWIMMNPAIPASPQIVVRSALLVWLLLMVLGNALIVLIASRLAIAVGWRDGAAAAAAFPAPGPRAVPLLCALSALALEWQFQFVGQQMLSDYRQIHPWLSGLGDVLGPLIIFGLAYLGAHWGAGRPDRLRPFRALSVSLVALIVKISATLAIGTVWAFGFATLSRAYRMDVSDVLELFALLLVSWLTLSVLIMRWFAAIFYDRHQRAGVDA